MTEATPKPSDLRALPDPNDPRVNLKPGLRDAGVAARGMELVSTRPRPEGFYDP